MDRVSRTKVQIAGIGPFVYLKGGNYELGRRFREARRMET